MFSRGHSQNPLPRRSGAPAHCRGETEAQRSHISVVSGDMAKSPSAVHCALAWLHSALDVPWPWPQEPCPAGALCPSLEPGVSRVPPGKPHILSPSLCPYRQADRQVSRVGSHPAAHQCGDQRRGEGGSLPRTVHLPARGEQPRQV